MRNSTMRCFRLARSLSSYHDTFSTRHHHKEIHTLYRKPCRIRAIVISWRPLGWFVMYEPVWSVHGPHVVLGDIGSHGHHSTFRLISQVEYVARCPLVCTAWPANSQSPSFVSLGLLVIFSCRSGLNIRGGVSGVHAAGGTPTPNYTQKNNNKHPEPGARTYKYTNKCRDARAQTCQFKNKHRDARAQKQT